ncbi:MAG: CHAD domain-containing protein [Candidatus Acidiferrales bacterium]
MSAPARACPESRDPGRTSAASKKHATGLAHWMRRVLKECGRVEQGLDPEAVHDLRVSLRRCRSLASSLQQLDPSTSWRKMRRAGRKLFRSLGELRDAQVLTGWVKKLVPEDDPVRKLFLGLLAKREEDAKVAALHALAHFDRKRWRRWARLLPARARAVSADGLVAQHLALERWSEAFELDRRAHRTRSRVAWHRLRIGLKRFRYTAENFLPRRYAEWGADLKFLQDLLGEVHDLDVLQAALQKFLVAATPEIRTRWESAIARERDSRLAAYREKMSGANSLWQVWRANLPESKRLEAAASAKFRAWASLHDPDVAHAHRVALLALQVFDAFAAAEIHGFFRETRARRILHVAALLHDAGRCEGDRGHHKGSYRLIREHAPPFGWTPEELSWIALVARYHRGAEPRDTHEGFDVLPPAEKQSVSWLAAVLRFADALDADHSGHVTSLSLVSTPEALVIEARGFSAQDDMVENLSRKKRLLERLCGRPVIVRGVSEQPAESPAVALAS